MIYGIVGRPGGGKSYEAVAYHVLPALKEGRKVITNLPLQIDHFAAVLGDEVRQLIVVVDGKLNDFGSMERPFSKVSDYEDDWRNTKGQGPLFVVDEAHMTLPNRNLNTEILEWYSLHRHYGVDIILVTQNLRKIHRDIKDMIEVTYYCAKNTALGSNNTYTKKVRSGANGDVVNTSIRKYEQAYFPFYKSHTASNSSVTEAMAADIVPLWKRWPVIGSLLFMVLGIALSVWAFSPKESPKVMQPTAPQVKKVTEAVPAGTPTKEVKANNDWFGPLDNFHFFATGYSKQIAYVSYRTSSQINDELSFYKIYIDVYDKQQKLFSIEHIDLQEMGYKFTVLAECVYQITWDGIDRIVTCGKIEEEKARAPDLFDSALPIDI
ncbi:assembly protein [Vibrio sp. D420a]|uniref:zonular occludens toxin domain-containing protein n=1 Tax=Vibrio sp. D420a TaxID=2836895 RepID=UPI002554936B|nr:zonular occludens toxin domain-containing protein [Vibrio sp. D420a]MDK9764908.1 assembly protein [Vibrio sp. D420a]